jgi:hypothetical protein
MTCEVRPLQRQPLKVSLHRARKSMELRRSSVIALCIRRLEPHIAGHEGRAGGAGRRRGFTVTWVCLQPLLLALP